MGRTGRAEAKGNAILLHTAKEKEKKEAIEELMKYKIPALKFPEEVEVNDQLMPEEMSKNVRRKRQEKWELEKDQLPPGFHEKKAKNSKVAIKGSKRRREMAAKYNKPKTRGDKNQSSK